jgi:hypothetical protein
MDQRISVSVVHEAIKLSVPYDEYSVVQAFYNFYSTLPNEGEEKWTIEYNKQNKYMTIKQIFERLSNFTQNMLDRHAIKDRMIGNIAVLGKVPFEEVETIAKIQETAPSS